MNKEWWIQKRNDWERALLEIAREAAPGSPTYKALGTVAWTRYDGERTAREHLDHIAFGAGFLQGVRYGLLQAASVGKFNEEPFRTIYDKIHRYEAERDRRTIYATPRSKSPTAGIAEGSGQGGA